MKARIIVAVLTGIVVAGLAFQVVCAEDSATPSQDAFSFYNADKARLEAALKAKHEEFALLSGRLAGRQNNLDRWHQRLSELEMQKAKLGNPLDAGGAVDSLTKLSDAEELRRKIAELKTRCAKEFQALGNDHDALKQSLADMKVLWAQIDNVKNKLASLGPDRGELRPGEGPDRPTETGAHGTPGCLDGH